jgi:hypothetical protein
VGQDAIIPTRGGRPRGSLNKVTQAGRAFAQAIVEDEDFRKKLLGQAKEGVGSSPIQLPPTFAITLLYYAYGKPVDRVSVAALGQLPYQDESDEELAARADELARKLRAEKGGDP